MRCLVGATVLSLAVLMATATMLWAQQDDEKFPLMILGGETFTVPASYDTLWLITNRQLNRSIQTAMKLEIDSSMTALLQRKVELLNQIIVEKDSLIAFNRQGYLHYRDLWEETDYALEEAEIKAARRWRWGMYGFYIGVGIAAAVFIALK